MAQKVSRGRSPPTAPPSPTLPIPPPSCPPTPTSPNVPSLTMLIDRTSFDETDDYGVDMVALGSTEWGKDQLAFSHGPPAVAMRNGKVRRRLRWRPNSMLKKRRPLPLSPDSLSVNLPGSFNKYKFTTSSSGSVTSNQSSKAPSLHSFASIATQVKSNTTKSQMNSLQFPLPLPKYFKSLDETVPYVSSVETFSTIETEGDTILLSPSMSGGKPPKPPTMPKSSVTSSPTTTFTVVANDVASATGTHEEKKDMEQYNLTRVTSPIARTSSLPSTLKKSALPPLFKAIGISGRPRVNSFPSLDEIPVSQKRKGESIKGHKRYNSDSNVSVPARFQSTSVNLPEQHRQQQQLESQPKLPEQRRQQQQSESLPKLPEQHRQQQQLGSLPKLSGDDVERDRVVDLRRVPSPSSHFYNGLEDIVASSSQMAFDDGEGFPLIAELRSRSTGTQSLPGRPPLSPSLPSAFQATSQGSISNFQLEDKLDALVGPVIGPSASSPEGPSNLESASCLCSVPNTFKAGVENDGSDEMTCSNPASPAMSEDLQLSLEPVGSNRYANKDIVPESFSKDANTYPEKTPARAFYRQLLTVPVDLDECCFLEAEKNLQAIHDMAAEHLLQGEYDEALEVFEEIMRGQLVRYGKDHFRVGTALHNIGIVHMKRRDYEKAVNAYKEALIIRKKTLAPDHPDIATSLAQLGVAYLERKMYKKAITKFRDALRMRRRCLGPSHPKVAKILNNIGCALYEINALPIAKVAFEEALEIQRLNLRDSPADHSNRSDSQLLSIASTLSNIASIKLYLNMPDEASVDFQAALLIQQCVLGDDHSVPKHTEASLKWMEESMGAHSTFISPSRLDLISKILTASFAECTNPEMKVDHEDRSIAADNGGRGDEDDILDGFIDFHTNLDFGCGPEVPR